MLKLIYQNEVSIQMKLHEWKKSLVFLVTFIGLNCIAQEYRHIGEWRGANGSLTLKNSGDAILIAGNNIIGGNGYKINNLNVDVKFEINYAKSPIWLDLVFYEVGKNEMGRFRGIVRFITHDKIEFRFNADPYGIRRFNTFNSNADFDLLFERVTNTPTEVKRQLNVPQSELGINLIKIQGGDFTMGDVWADVSIYEASPTRRVSLNSFSINSHEISNSQYIAFLNSGRVTKNGMYEGRQLIDMEADEQAIDYGNKFYFKGSLIVDTPNCPVINVTWFGAVEYCNWLSIVSGYQPCYKIGDGTNVICNWSANGYRLPTEAEWEYAARSRGRADRKWSGTNIEDELSRFGWYETNSSGKTHATGAKQPNDLGLYDMSGNVGEWCWDWHDGYNLESQLNPKGPIKAYKRIIRGGGWYFKSNINRTSARQMNFPHLGSKTIGFRVARNG